MEPMEPPIFEQQAPMSPDTTIRSLSSSGIDAMVAETVTNTVVFQSILGISIVALIITILEIVSLIYIVFPQMNEQIKKRLQHQSFESLRPLKPLIKTLATRETAFTKRANTYIEIVAWVFVFLLFLVCSILFYLIDNAYRLQHKQGAPSGTFYTIVLWSIITTFGIAVFQGFGCIAMGHESPVCNMNSFAVVSSEWKQNKNYSHIALSTGICDDVADTESFPGKQNFDTVLSLYIARQFANQQDSDPNTIFQELASDDAQDMLSRLSRLRRSTGVLERT
uniref:Uncharacterized protein n=1 Tax=viral metagenome TaxID=1070528 RepID=A0A6C0IZI7_9ZZZZ